MIEFLSNESSAIEITQEEGNHSNSFPKQVCSSSSNVKFSCYDCGQMHYLSECEKFKQLSFSDKINFLNSINLCHNCFGKGHRARDCKKTIRCKKCNNLHHTLIHKNETAPICHLNFNKKELYLPTINIFSNPKMPSLFTLLDSGSQISLINRRALCNLDNYKLFNSPQMDISGVFGSNRTVNSPKLVKFMAYGNDQTTEIEAIVVDDLDIVVSVPEKDMSRGRRTIDMIIGVDVLPKILTGKIKTDARNGLSFETVFGWSGVGTSEPNPPNYCLSVPDIFSATKTNFEEILKRIWVQEIDTDSKNEEIAEHLLVEEHFQTHVSRDVSGRLQVAWPILSCPKVLCQHKEASYKRFQNLWKRFEADPWLKEEYDKIIFEYLSRNIIEKVEANCDESDFIRYLPHHPVVTTNGQKRKVRIVFDASAKDKNNISLNDLMATGPNLNPEICALLVRFRLYRYGLVADVEKAFLQLLLLPEQKDLTRFFWFADDGSVSIYRFNRVIFGARGSPFLLARSIRFCLDNQNEDQKETCQILSNNMYVDDFIASFHSDETCSKFVENSRSIFQTIKMNLRSWHSNLSMNDSSMDAVSVLGVLWKPVDDVLCIPEHKGLLPMECTKRNILKWMASFWDPYGVLCAILLRAKALIRDMWNQKIGWDDIVPNEMEEEWKRERKKR